MRRLSLAILLAAYAAVFVRVPSLTTRGTFDPLGARGREIEQAIEEQRFADALPILRQLQAGNEDNPLLAYWYAEVLGGLRQHGDEAKAWERVFELTGSADAACPALPEAYSRAGDEALALRAYERCAAAAPDDAERWMEVGAAYAASGRAADAAHAYQQSRALDPTNPRLPANVGAVSRLEGTHR